jgi:hypothetical protein
MSSGQKITVASAGLDQIRIIRITGTDENGNEVTEDLIFSDLPIGEIRTTETTFKTIKKWKAIWQDENGKTHHVVEPPWFGKRIARKIEYAYWNMKHFIYYVLNYWRDRE